MSMASPPQIQTHSYPYDLSHNLGFARGLVDLGRHVRSGVCLENQQTFALHAPAASEPVAMLDEVNRALIFMRPPAAAHPALALIDLHEGAGREDGVHGPIVQANKPIALCSGIESAEHGGRKPPPT